MYIFDMQKLKRYIIAEEKEIQSQYNNRQKDFEDYKDEMEEMIENGQDFLVDGYIDELIANKQYNDALHWIKKLNNVDRDYKLLTTAKIYLGLGRDEEALKIYRSNVAEDSDYCDGLIRYYVKKGDSTNARKWLKYCEKEHMVSSLAEDAELDDDGRF